MENRVNSHFDGYKNRWLVSYADFITLLLALFMVLYALTQIDITNLREFANSVDNVFAHNKKHYLQPLNPSQLIEKKKNLLKLFNTTQINIKSIPSGNTVNSSNELSLLKKQLKTVEQNLEKDFVSIQNTQTLLENKLNKISGIVVKKEPRGLLIRLKDAVLFDAGSDIIKTRANKVLDELAFVLKTCDNDIKIEGHTDNIPIKNDKFPSNWELSTSRATNILRYFVSKNRVNPSRFSAAGYGEYIPITENSNIYGRSINRRVDIIILNSASKIFEPHKVL